jgi:hydroxyacylglutathione hydrolase
MAKIIVHEKGCPHLINPTRLWQGSLQVLGKWRRIMERLIPVQEDRIITAPDGMIVDLGN